MARHRAPSRWARAGCCGLLLAAAMLLAPARAAAQAGAPAVAPAQPPPAASPPSRRTPPRTIGLALSGGAARGLAHIGVLKVLEEAGVPVRVVSGTSMGSVVGGLYAVGYTAAQLDTIATTLDWYGLLTDSVARRDLPVERKLSADRFLLTLPIDRSGLHLPRGVVTGQRISQVLSGLTWSVHAIEDFRQLPRGFAAVATDLETGQGVVLDHGFLPDALRASMALPSVFTPVELDGKALIDGGVVRNLPAQDARALGADFLICSDVTDPLDPRDSIITFVDVLVQAVSFREWDSEADERHQCDVLITPKVHGFSTLGFARARDIIARGEAAARAALPAIAAALPGGSEARGAGAARAPARRSDSVLVARVRFEHPGRVPQGLLTRTLGVRAPRWVSRRALDRGIDRLYATGLFQSVRYRLDPVPGGTPEERELAVLIGERSPGRFGLGLRYDSRYKASVLVSSTLGGVAGFGLSGQVNARLGQQIAVDVGASQPLGDGRTASLGMGALYARSPVDLYWQGREVAQARVDLGALSTAIARSVGTAADLSLRVKAEYAHWTEPVSAVASPPIDRTFYTVAGVLDIDTYDRGVYPRRGFGVRARSEWGNRLVASGGPFAHHFADVQGYLPLYRTVSLWGGASVGASSGDLPPHYVFSLGGANSYYLFPDRDVPFVGLRTQELRGRALQKVEVGAQWEFAPDVFGRVRWNAGNVYDRWTWNPRGYIDGVSVELGAKTFAGRFHVSFSGTAHTTFPRVEIDLGDPF